MHIDCVQSTLVNVRTAGLPEVFLLVANEVSAHIMRKFKMTEGEYVLCNSLYTFALNAFDDFVGNFTSQVRISSALTYCQCVR